VNYLLLAPELFTSEGGITRILRLYLKAICENAGKDDNVRFLSLNDRMVDSGDVRRFANERLVGWEVSGRNKMRFVIGAFKMGFSSDRIICGHIGQLPVAWAISKVRPRTTYYLVAHGIEVWRPFSMVERWALRGAKCVFCVSDYTRRQVLQHCPLPEGRTAVLYNALDPAMGAKAPLPPDANSFGILAISRLSLSDSYKGIAHMIAAMPMIREALPTARLRIVGRGDGLESLQKTAQKLNMSGAVEFAGYRNDSELAEEFAKCRIFALPSHAEGFGLVYLEAMANGRPCLGANSGGVPEVISEDSGVLVEYGDVPGIASAMVAALRRTWNVDALVGRAQTFSFARFKERLRALLAT
jgi:phosphatidyl-myo-inositol dimannoside synthase